MVSQRLHGKRYLLRSLVTFRGSCLIVHSLNWSSSHWQSPAVWHFVYWWTRAAAHCPVCYCLISFFKPISSCRLSNHPWTVQFALMTDCICSCPSETDFCGVSWAHCCPWVHYLDWNAVVGHPKRTVCYLCATHQLWQLQVSVVWMIHWLDYTCLSAVKAVVFATCRLNETFVWQMLLCSKVLMAQNDLEYFP